MGKQVKSQKYTPFSFLSKEKSTTVKTLVFCVSIVFIFLLLCWMLFRLISPQKQQFTVNQTADFYLVNSKSIQSYQLQNDQFQLTKTEDVSIAEDVNFWFPQGRFDNRYLVFSSGNTRGKASTQNIVSLDFQTGDIRKTSTPFYAYSGAGVSDKFFYTGQTTTEDGVLSMFDISGKLITQKTFSESTSFPIQFHGRGNRLYLGLGFHDESRQRPALVFDAYLVELDENDQLKELSRTPLTSEGKIVEMLTSSELIGDNYYSSVAYTRNTETFSKDPDNRILVMNLSSKEKHFIKLPEDNPNLLYKTLKEDRLIVKHEADGNDRCALSIVNLSDESSYLINVRKDLPDSTEEIIHIDTSLTNKVLVVTNQHFLLYSLENGQLLTKTKLELKQNDFPIATWFQN